MLLLLPLVVALATATPTPKPQPTNPFTLDPLPATPYPLPVIGTTRAKPLCTALRRAVAPALQAAMKNDVTYKVLRGRVFDYVAKDTETQRDMHLMQMDHTVDELVKSTNQLEDALKNPALDPPANAKPEDVKAMHDLKSTLSNVLAAQKVQLNAMSGFVETERMRSMGKMSEIDQQMINVTTPNMMVNGVMTTAPPISGFLRDDSHINVLPEHETPKSLHDAHLLDDDLRDIATFTQHTEEAATRVIVPAAERCK
ncbi:MAG TPA: hypothetical protein VFB22_10145 [Candidatus Baltobacteraceae bacterium]|nr:hypothetical protein [Candidatus Baltobacteraceae bacterium]